MARVMLLGLFHFNNPGLDAVKYEPVDVTKPDLQVPQCTPDPPVPDGVSRATRTAQYTAS
jgi:hypothetical protein